MATTALLHRAAAAPILRTMPRLPSVVSCLFLVACAGPSRRVIATPDAPAAIGPYSQAVVADGQVWVAGQIGLDPHTRLLVPGGIGPEAQQAMANVVAILAAAGGSAADIVQVQVFLADIQEYDAFNAVYAAFFGGKAPPARAAVQVAALPRGARVEVLATARLP
jgi:2-iminobutanoate/2-iminopropanoate deaminase